MVWSCVIIRRPRLLAVIGLTGAMALVAGIGLTPAEAAKRSKSTPTYSPPAAAMVVDVNTGRTLYAENVDEPRIPASITKVMTLYLLFEQLESKHFTLDTRMRVTKNAAAQPPSRLGVKAGGTIRVEDAIKALVTRSANDVAVVVAENIGGTEADFAAMMTRKARALGMKSTTFRNPHGLPANPPNITTARDLTVLGRAIQDRFPQYYAYFSTRSFNYAGQTIGNHNRLLGRVEGVDGIKTGYTRASGFNLLTSMKVGKRHVVAAVLGGASSAQRDRKMELLLNNSLPKAYAGARTVPAIVDRASARRATPPVQVADASGSIGAEAAPMPVGRPLQIGKPIDLSDIRPVVASATGATATPAFRSASAQPDTSMIMAYAAMPNPEPRPTSLASSAPAATVQTAAVTSAPAPQQRPTGSAGWVIQLGASADLDKANGILKQARLKSRGMLANASPFTEKVTRGNVTLYRARFSGFEPEEARAACKSLKRSGFDCFATRG